MLAVMYIAQMFKIFLDFRPHKRRLRFVYDLLNKTIAKQTFYYLTIHTSTSLRLQNGFSELQWQSQATRNSSKLQGDSYA